MKYKEKEPTAGLTLVDASEYTKDQGATFRDGLPAICYLAERNRYYFFNDHTKKWQRSTKGNIKLRLLVFGYDPIPILLRLQAEHVMDDVREELGDLPAGIHVQNGKRILVRSGKGVA
jgi:hypothetical protein